MKANGVLMKLKNDFKDYLIEYKLLYTILIVSVYLIGRLVPLYGVDTGAYSGASIDAERIMKQVIGGDINRHSLFALGISPYMVASIFSSTVMSLRKSDNKGNISPITINRVTILITLVVAIIQAGLRVHELTFIYTGHDLHVAKATAMIEMTVGALFILWLSERNKRYGFGGQTALIFVNVIVSITSVIKDKKPIDLVIPILVSYIAMNIMLRMENGEKRIPVQRISIHNIYADKNYLAIKLNPIGIMPVMFATAFFMIPQMVLGVIHYFAPANETIAAWKNNLTMQTKQGVICYLIILFLITMFFSFVFVNPRDIAEQFLKSGDSVVNVHAGSDTRRYIVHSLLLIGAFSGVIMCICMGIPLLLQLGGAVDSELAMLPSTVMILTGIWCTLYQEVLAVKKLDSYRPFI